MCAWTWFFFFVNFVVRFFDRVQKQIHYHLVIFNFKSREWQRFLVDSNRYWIWPWNFMRKIISTLWNRIKVIQLFLFAGNLSFTFYAHDQSFFSALSFHLYISFSSSWFRFRFVWCDRMAAHKRRQQLNRKEKKHSVDYNVCAHCNKITSCSKCNWSRCEWQRRRLLNAKERPSEKTKKTIQMREWVTEIARLLENYYETLSNDFRYSGQWTILLPFLSTARHQNWWSDNFNPKQVLLFVDLQMHLVNANRII